MEERPEAGFAVRQPSIYRAFATALTQTETLDETESRRRNDVFCEPMGPFALDAAYLDSFIDVLIISRLRHQTFLQLVEDIVERIAARIIRKLDFVVEIIKNGQRIKLWHISSEDLVTQLQQVVDTSQPIDFERTKDVDKATEDLAVNTIISRHLSASPISPELPLLWALRLLKPSQSRIIRTWPRLRSVLFEAGILGPRNWSVQAEAAIMRITYDRDMSQSIEELPAFIASNAPLESHWTSGEGSSSSDSSLLSRGLESALSESSTVESDNISSQALATYLQSFGSFVQITLKSSALHEGFDNFESAVISFADSIVSTVPNSRAFPNLLFEAETESLCYILGFQSSPTVFKKIERLLEDFVFIYGNQFPFVAETPSAPELRSRATLSIFTVASSSREIQYDQKSSTAPSKYSEAKAEAVTAARLRPAQDVFSRIRWDSGTWDPYKVVIGYLDRHQGLKEIAFTKWTTDVSEEEFVPLHRVRYFRLVDVEGAAGIVWDREKRIDRIFGSKTHEL